MVYLPLTGFYWWSWSNWPRRLPWTFGKKPLKMTIKQHSKKFTECFLRVLKDSLVSKVIRENRDKKEKRDHLDLGAWLEKQGLRYMSS